MEVKCLIHKHEYLGFNLKNLHKNLVMAVPNFFPSSGKAECPSKASQASQNSELLVHLETYAQKKKKQNKRRKQKAYDSYEKCALELAIRIKRIGIFLILKFLLCQFSLYFLYLFFLLASHWVF